MAHGGDVGEDRAPAERVEAERLGFGGEREDRRFEGGHDLQTVRLPERNEPHARRNEIGRESVKVGRQSEVEREAVRRRGEGDGDGVSRIGDVVEGAWMRPRRLDRLDEGAALREGFEGPFAGGLKSGCEFGQVGLLGAGRAMDVGEQDGVSPSGAMAQRVFDP